MLKLIAFALGFIANFNRAALLDGFAHIRQEQHIALVYGVVVIWGPRRSTAGLHS